MTKRNGLDASALDEYWRSVFHAAVQNGQLQSLKLLFKSTDELLATDFKGRTLLHLAASQGFTIFTEFMVSKEHSVLIRDKDGLTPLHISAFNRNLEVVIVPASSISRDVNKGIEVRTAGTRHDDVEAETHIDSKDFRGRTALFCASQQVNRDIVEFLADRYNAKVDLRDKNSITPLAETAFRGHTEVVKTLAGKFNADCLIASLENKTALHCAIRGGYSVIVDFLNLTWRASGAQG